MARHQGSRAAIFPPVSPGRRAARRDRGSGSRTQDRGGDRPGGGVGSGTGAGGGRGHLDPPPGAARLPLLERRISAFEPDAVVLTRHAIRLGEDRLRRVLHGRYSAFWYFDLRIPPLPEVVRLGRLADVDVHHLPARGRDLSEAGSGRGALPPPGHGPRGRSTGRSGRRTVSLGCRLHRERSPPAPDCDPPGGGGGGDAPDPGAGLGMGRRRAAGRGRPDLRQAIRRSGAGPRRSRWAPTPCPRWRRSRGRRRIGCGR